MGFLSKIFGKSDASEARDDLGGQVDAERKRQEEERRKIEEVQKSSKAAVERRFKAEPQRIAQLEELNRLQAMEFAREIGKQRMQMAERQIFSRGIRGSDLSAVGDEDPAATNLAAESMGLDVNSFRSNQINKLSLRQQLISGIGNSAGLASSGLSGAAQLQNIQNNMARQREASKAALLNSLTGAAGSIAGSAIGAQRKPAGGFDAPPEDTLSQNSFSAQPSRGIQGQQFAPPEPQTSTQQQPFGRSDF